MSVIVWRIDFDKSCKLNELLLVSTIAWLLLHIIKKKANKIIKALC